MRLNVNEYFFHSINGCYNLSLSKLSSILESGYIKSMRDLEGEDAISDGMHRANEICLAEYTNAKVSGAISAFDIFASISPTLILDKDIETSKPIVIPSIEVDEADVSSGRYTNIYDEVRTTNAISTSHIKGISFPITSLLLDDFKYLFFTDDFLFSLATMGFGELLAGSMVIDPKLSYFRKERNLKKMMNYMRKVLKKYDKRVPIYDYYESNGEPVFELIKRR